jgi:hypothetical protein
MNKLILLFFGLIFTIPAWSQVLSPPNQSQINSTRPTISAEFNNRVRDARIWVDGTEFTDHMRTQGDSVVLVPPYNLDYGVHQVQIVADNGQQVNWAFAIVRNGMNNGQGNTYPRNNDPYYYPNDGGYYPNGGPGNSPTNNGGYYPNDNRYPSNGNTRPSILDILPDLLPQILNNRRY